MAKIIKANGEEAYIKPKDGKKFSLEELQNVVGGYIEVTYTHTDDIMIVNEEGKLKGLPLNVTASSLHKYNDFIVGDVLFIPKSEIKYIS